MHCTAVLPFVGEKDQSFVQCSRTETPSPAPRPQTSATWCLRQRLSFASTATSRAVLSSFDIHRMHIHAMDIHQVLHGPDMTPSRCTVEGGPTIPIRRTRVHPVSHHITTPNDRSSPHHHVQLQSGGRSTPANPSHSYPPHASPPNDRSSRHDHPKLHSSNTPRPLQRRTSPPDDRSSRHDHA